MNCSRKLTFLGDGLRHDIELAATGDVTVERLVEQIPFLNKEGTAVRFRVGDEWSAEPRGKCGAVRFANAGAGVIIEFTELASVKLGAPSRHHGQEIGAVEVELGGRWQEGRTVRLSYIVGEAP